MIVDEDEGIGGIANGVSKDFARVDEVISQGADGDQV